MHRPRRPQNLPMDRVPRASTPREPPSGVFATARGLFDRARQMTDRHQGVSAAELAADAQVSRGAAFQVLTGLEHMGLAVARAGRFYAQRAA